VRSGVQRFVGEKLTEARQARGISSRKALADLMQRAPSTVIRWEEGETSPEPAALAELAAVLKVPEEFFLSCRQDENAGPVFFRSFAGALKADRLVQLARLRWLADVTAIAEHYAFLPEVNVPDLLSGRSFRSLRDEDIEASAAALRDHWGLGLRPIPNVLSLVESHGVIVASETMETSKLDGLSRWGSDGRPYILLANDKQSFARRQFDVAHELAHLALHRSVDEAEFEDNFKLIEDQAHKFASAFLLPAEQFCVEVDNITMSELERLKVRWRVSIKAQIMRLHRLNIIDSDMSQRLYKAYSARGYQSKGEPHDKTWPLQQPSTLADVFIALVDAGRLSKDVLRDDLPLLPHDVESLAGLASGWLTAATAKVVEFKPEPGSRRSVASDMSAQIIDLPRNKR
jgi:Zn-dependent peptidase ImmA (M78 family)